MVLNEHILVTNLLVAFDLGGTFVFALSGRRRPDWSRCGCGRAHAQCQFSRGRYRWRGILLWAPLYRDAARLAASHCTPGERIGKDHGITQQLPPAASSVSRLGSQPLAVF